MGTLLNLQPVRTAANVRTARANGGLLDLRPGDRVRDGEGDVATFVGYGRNEPLYVDLEYAFSSKPMRLPNSELKLVSRAEEDDAL